ncbi:hypothetical protein [Yoonia sp. R78084]|uniref:hypothetical protein n=1 Tax=Yoonia sp. R78084 TaxID=3093869 RepID=UPI0037DC2001
MPFKLKSSIVSSLVMALLSIWVTTAQAQERPLTQRVIQSGHSLTDGVLDPLREMVRQAGNSAVVIDKSTIPGSPMDFRWTNVPGYGQPDARHDIARYDTLVLTERVELSNTIQWHNSPDFALQWFNNAWTNGKNGNGAETILYATWVNIDSGPEAENPYKDPERHIVFRDRLPLEMERWLTILDHVNESRPAGSAEMRMIPGPLLMAAIYDDIAAGKAPGLTDISDLFSDTIHLNDLGNYYIALAHFAVIYGRDPRGLQNLNGVTPEQARYMQDLVWKVLSE